MFSSTVDFHRTRVEGEETADQGPAPVIHCSCLWITEFSIRNSATLPSFPQHLKRRDLPKPKRYKDVGILARQVAVQSRTTVQWRWLAVRHYSTTCLHRTATAAGLTSPFHFILSLAGWMRLEGAVLVDSLEALRVLDGHQELLSQVFKWFIGG